MVLAQPQDIMSTQVKTLFTSTSSRQFYLSNKRGFWFLFLFFCFCFFLCTSLSSWSPWPSWSSVRHGRGFLRFPLVRRGPCSCLRVGVILVVVASRSGSTYLSYLVKMVLLVSSGSRPPDKWGGGGRRSPKILFPASVWSKNKGVPPPPGPSPGSATAGHRRRR